jgi:phenylacetate-coenzyme A ligase PaaK-like adenylate-forming protein
MTKHDLMADFDRIVTDPRLTLSLVEDHMASIRGDAYLLGRYHAVASGGSSGRRGVFLYDWEGWRECHLGFWRHLLRRPAPAGRMDVAALVAAGHPTHFSATLPRTFSGAGVVMRRVPVTLSADAIVALLNDLQPTILCGYPSALHQLTFAAHAGALRIAPRIVFCSSEPLLPETRSALADAWGVPVLNCWGASEGGPMAAPCAEGDGMHLSEDLHVIEFVDREGRPVPAGAPADKVYLTNLFNPVLPLIRYEVTDEVRLIDEPCRCGSTHRRVADIEGRLDEAFRYQGMTVHPHVFRSRLGRQRAIDEYQVRQTERGAVVTVRCRASLDLAGLAGSLTDDLRRLGLAEPDVTVERAERIERGAAGKLRRFVPLLPVPAPGG